MTAQRGPFVEAAAMAANIDHGVDRARATENPSSCDIDAAVFEAGLRRCRVSPVLGSMWIPEAGQWLKPVAVDCRISVHAAQFDQGDGDRGISAESGGEHAACGTSSNDDV